MLQELRDLRKLNSGRQPVCPHYCRILYLCLLMKLSKLMLFPLHCYCSQVEPGAWLKLYEWSESVYDERRERRGERGQSSAGQMFPTPGDAMALMLESIVLNEIPHTKPAGRGLYCPDWIVWWHRRPNWCSVITKQIRSDYSSDLSGLVCLVPGGSWWFLVVPGGDSEVIN